MLNKLCVFHLNRATNRDQTKEETRLDLERNEHLFIICRQILDTLKQEIQETAVIKGNGSTSTKLISSKTEPLDEDALFEKLRLQCDAILAHNASLTKYFQLPDKL